MKRKYVFTIFWLLIAGCSSSNSPQQADAPANSIPELSTIQDALAGYIYTLNGNVIMTLNDPQKAIYVSRGGNIVIEGWVIAGDRQNAMDEIDGVYPGGHVRALIISRPDVAAQFNNQALLMSGYRLTLSGELLAPGLQTIQIVGGRNHRFYKLPDVLYLDVDGANSRATSTDGTVSIEARISDGSRFVVYFNDIWTAPQTLPVAKGAWRTYQFRVPLTLRSLRFDPTELAGADVEIKSVKFDYPGRPPRWMPLSDLPKWIQYHAATSLEPGGREVRIHTDNKDMYVMSIVDVNTYFSEPPK